MTPDELDDPDLPLTAIVPLEQIRGDEYALRNLLFLARLRVKVLRDLIRRPETVRAHDVALCQIQPYARVIEAHPWSEPADG